MITSSGRCHGPGCTQTADSDFCSERCSKAWAAALADPDHWRERVSAAVARYAADPELARRELSGLPASSDAAYSQVAPENPQVVSDPDPMRGWLRRAFDRLFGRTA